MACSQRRIDMQNYPASPITPGFPNAGATGDSAQEYRRIFEGPKTPSSPGMATAIQGMKRSSMYCQPAVISEGAPTFKFTARFKNCRAGHYVVQWRVNVLANFSIPNGLRFSANVTYTNEADIMSSVDVVMEPCELVKRDCLYDLELEELVVIHPHEGHASVEVTLSNNDSMDNLQYSGLQVDSIDFRPFAEYAESQTHATAHKQVVKRVAVPEFTIDAMESPVFSHENHPGIPATLPISRLAWSKDSTFLAALALWNHTAYITVWDMRHIPDSPTHQTEMSILHRHCATTFVRHDNQKDFGNLSIGLAISPRGDQVAIYQEPRVGQWKSESKLDKCEFQFCLLDNPLAKPHVTVNMTKQAAENTYGVVRLERIIGLPHPALKSFTGYGAFLTEKAERDWETIDVNTALSSTVESDDRRSSAARTLFAACNGLDLSVFKINSEQKWTYIHTINLSDLVPMLNRRITCKMMMEMITSNTFMWLEGGGLCCTIWDLQKGSNVSYISSTDHSKFGSSIFRGNTKMAISPDQSMVALTSADGILKTYYTNTGILIDWREFSDHKIVYVAFHGHGYQLFVVIQDNISLNLSSRILDPLQLKSETIANQVPIPIIGKTVLAFLHKGSFQNKGLVCEADGNKIHCYVTHEPSKFKIARSENTLVRPSQMEYEKQGKRYELRPGNHREAFRDGNGLMYWVLFIEVVEMDLATMTPDVIFSFVPEPWMRVSTIEVPYSELQQTYFLPGGTRFVVVGMQTLQVWSLPTGNTDCCNLDFIWSRPISKDDPVFDPSARRYKTELVGNFYHHIHIVTIYLDHVTGNAVADINLMNGAKANRVSIPPTYGSYPQVTFLYCARSIHLLAAAYLFSFQDDEKLPGDAGHADDAIARFTHGHINRLLSAEDFFPRQQTSELTQSSPAQAHPEPGGTQSAFIFPNVSLEVIAMSPTMYTIDEDVDSNPAISSSNNISRSGTIKAKRRRRKGAESNAVATVLTLLLDKPELKDANHVFLEGLLHLAEGAWVPHASKDLNLVSRAIKVGNEQLLKTLIDYCIKSAMARHPLYLVPVDQCLSELIGPYPDMVADIFRRASYIPAHNQAYVAIGASLNFLDLAHFRPRPTPYASIFSKLSWKPRRIEDCQSPVFALRSQLPTSTTILGGVNGRDTHFPPEQIGESSSRVSFNTIYVCPFQFLPSTRSIRGLFDAERKESVFTQMAGKNFFDSPAVVVILRFKWHKFGLKYWLIRFMSVLLLFILVLIITAKQIAVSTLVEITAEEFASGLYKQPAPDDVYGRFHQPTPQDIQARYLTEWRPVFILTAVWGLIMVFYEFLQLIESPLRYISSPYNYVDLAAFITPVVGCFLFLETSPGIQPDTGMDGGPSQIWIMSFAILILYVDILFELRVFKQLGFAVNIIFNITRRIKWFFMIFFLFLVCFTHALLYILHTRRFRPCHLDKCINMDFPDTYPTNFFSAASATYFFLSGQYDPIQSSLELGTVNFHAMMAIFYFFTAIVVLNVLIALMNDAFVTTDKEGEIAHLKLLSEVITEMETHLMTNNARRRSDYYPRYIYYCASEEEVVQFRSKYSISDNSNPLDISAAPNSNNIMARRPSQATVPMSITRRGSQATPISDFNALRENLRAEHLSRVNVQDKMRQELRMISEENEGERSHRFKDHEELKQELSELKELVSDLMLELRTRNMASRHAENERPSQS